MTLIIVLAFPGILFAGFGTAYWLLRGDAQRLAGPLGFWLFIGLLTVPLLAVVLAHPHLPGERFTPGPWTPAWLVAGLAAGLTLWGIQWLMVRNEPAQAGVWVGPPGRLGYALLMLPVAYVVAAEELVWRGYLTPVLGEKWGATPGLVLASAAFGLHHYHFGVRHIVFAAVAGLVWGAIFLAEGSLYGAVASHLLYNACAWAWMRRRAAVVSSVQPTFEVDQSRAV